MTHARTPAFPAVVHRFRPRPRPLHLALVALAPWLAAAAQAQEQERVGTPAALPPVTVTEPPDGSPTASSVEERRQTLNRTVGSVGFVDSESYKGAYAQTLRDILADDAQDAWTVEAGTRGRSGRFAWDVTAYRSWIDGELLQFTVNPSIPATTFNADKTIHQGFELAGSAQVLRDISGRNAGDALTIGALWNWSDFRFDGDTQYGDNRIAGVPEHLLRFSVTYGRPDGFYVTPTVDWVPSGAFADQANTLRIPSYVVLGVQTGLQLDNGVLLFVEGRNMTDERYVSDVGTITDARVAGTSIFYPGEGRSIFGGVRYAF